MLLSILERLHNEEARTAAATLRGSISHFVSTRLYQPALYNQSMMTDKEMRELQEFGAAISYDEPFGKITASCLREGAAVVVEHGDDVCLDDEQGTPMSRFYQNQCSRTAAVQM